MESISQATTERKTAFILQDGIHDFDDPVDRFCVVVGGEIVNYATFWATAAYQFKEAARIRREHLRREMVAV